MDCAVFVLSGPSTEMNLAFDIALRLRSKNSLVTMTLKIAARHRGLLKQHKNDPQADP